MRPLRVSFVVVVAVLLAGSPGCRCGGTEGAGVSADGAAPPSTGADASGAGALAADGDVERDERDDAGSEASGDASLRFRDAAPAVDRDLDGPPDPACTGAEISFAAAVVDPRCAIDSARARKLRARLERDGGIGLRQDAKVNADGRVALRLLNKSGTALSLPLSFHGKLPAFSVLAEDDVHTLYELEPPELELRDRGEGSRSHFARIVLLPDAAAVATLTISPAILRVLGRGAGDRCRDAGPAEGGPCHATRLAKGHYVLHVGELLTDVEAGAPARVVWDLP
ncbi:MAG TPA: hypothetical protein VLT33_25670 [Labilithrix sp.]|nr:hypothetical protein [Labilithrix sp.]